MKVSTLAAASLLPAYCSAHLFPRGDKSQDKGEDQTEVDKIGACYPAIQDGEATVPPCVEIGAIEQVCEPSGSSKEDLEFHAACMCGGSFFQDWAACQDCLFMHGLRNERDREYWDDVLAAASSSLCSGEPTAEFRSIFASIENDAEVPFVTAGPTASVDRIPGQTAVNLYYTAEGSQGPGCLPEPEETCLEAESPAVTDTDTPVTTHVPVTTHIPVTTATLVTTDTPVTINSPVTSTQEACPETESPAGTNTPPTTDAPSVTVMQFSSSQSPCGTWTSNFTTILPSQETRFPGNATDMPEGGAMRARGLDIGVAVVAAALAAAM